MTEIAQNLLARQHEDNSAIREWAGRLAVPWSGNHVVVPSIDGPRYAAAATNTCQLYVISSDVFEFIKSVSRSAKRNRISKTYVKLPHDKMWLEYRLKTGFDYAIGIEKCDAGWAIDIFISSGKWWCSFLINMEAASISASVSHSLYNNDMRIPSNDELTRLTANAVWVVVLMNISGALTSTRITTREGRIAQKRGRARVPCVLSYNKIDLPCLPSTRTRSPSRFAEGPGVRRHEVRGHPHLYRLRTGEMVLRWIAAYWRGNAAKGVVLKQRTLVAA